MNKKNIQNTGCCPRFDPRKWDGKEMNFEGKVFTKHTIRALFHIPVNFGSVMGRAWKQLMKTNAVPKEALWISDEVSMWKSELYLLATKEVPGAKMARIDGRFLSQSYKGDFHEIGNMIKKMQQLVFNKGKKLKRMLFHYPYCPKCAKKYGENYVVILGQVA